MFASAIPRAIVLAAALVAAPALAWAQGAAADTGWAEVGGILQTPAVAQGGYHRFNFPRRDVTLTMGGVTVAPALALGG